MNPQDENQDTAQNSAYNAFPEPQTIPAGWDTSVLFIATAAPDVRAEDSVASEAEEVDHTQVYR